LLALMKQTNRERDYAVIGELARKMERIEEQLLFSRSARDLVRLVSLDPKLALKLSQHRSLLAVALAGDIGSLEQELDKERRSLIHQNEKRLKRYQDAAQQWKNYWPQIEEATQGKSLLESHRIAVEKAQTLLPQEI